MGSSCLAALCPVPWQGQPWGRSGRRLRGLGVGTVRGRLLLAPGHCVAVPLQEE